MDRCAKEWNNVGASQLVNGMFSTAIDSFTRSLRIVRNALAVLATTEEKDADATRCSSSGPSVLPPRHFGAIQNQEEDGCPVIHTRDSFVATMVKSRPSLVVRDDDDDAGPLLHGLYVSPLYLSEIACYDRYETMVEASVAVMFNLALAHHLNSILGNKDDSSQQQHRTQGLSYSRTLAQATALYELAFTVQMQEKTDIDVEFAMAIVNNLGHAHRLMGDDEKADRCFRHLLTTIMFLRSCVGGGVGDDDDDDEEEQQQRPSSWWCDDDGSWCCPIEIFIHSVSYLVLRRTAAAAA
ncbi:tetratricopeptide repeat protein [Nitzschia inconspicua]|uniref:Tetratricopeptide repeat protein n=1 Tax=Nitzschia inconspicua TaxID=303405 RepID=A0A9K3KRM3_9STRA|nr:tetratricopeptide repeat protein [Nitzschia inconspicua]